MMFKHYDNGNGYEYCSGREGWSSRKTTLPALVTCKNCLKQMARNQDKPREPLRNDWPLVSDESRDY